LIFLIIILTILTTSILTSVTTIFTIILTILTTLTRVVKICVCGQRKKGCLQDSSSLVSPISPNAQKIAICDFCKILQI